MYVISQVYVIYVAIMFLFPLQMFMNYCLQYPEESLIVLRRKRSICFVFNKKILNPTKLLLIALTCCFDASFQFELILNL